MPPDETQNPDEPVLDESWGAFAGYTASEALRVMTSMHSEMAAENQRLRSGQQQQTATPPPAPSPPPEKREERESVKPDLETIRGEDPERAAQALAEYTQTVTEEAIQRREAERMEKNFSTDRLRAKQDALGILRGYGVSEEEFKQYEQVLDQNMQEGKGVSKELQINPNAWVQSYIMARGVASLKPQDANGTEQTPTQGRRVSTTPFAERPSPRRPPQHEPQQKFDSPDEEKSFRNFQRVLSSRGGMSEEEWHKLDEKDFQLDDYEQWLAEQDKKKKTIGRRP